MDYKLFDDYITLQSLLKDQGIIETGGGIKLFLAENIVLVNGVKEDRRRKKLYKGDLIEMPDADLSISIVAPSSEEKLVHQEELIEKEHLSKKIKDLNKQNKKPKTTVRFPGT